MSTRLPLDGRIKDCLLGLLLFAISLLLYSPSLESYAFLVYDDFAYVVKNPLLHAPLGGATLVRSFYEIHVGNYHPVTMLSLVLDYQWAGLDPGGYRLTNILFHSANAGLLFAWLAMATSKRGFSFFCALLFAVHPTHVESVVWISSRKDVLALFFFLLGLIAYTRWIREKSLGKFCAVTFAFTLALLSKPTAVTFSCVLLLLDLWPLQRYAGIDSIRDAFRKFISLCMEKVPWLLLSFFFSVMTYLAQDQALGSIEAFPLSGRILNAMVSYAKYIAHTLWPVDLTLFYSPPGAIALGEALLSGAILACITVSAVCCWKKQPFVLVGWLFFLGTLVPCIGLVQVGSQAMADRYLYLSGIGLLWLLLGVACEAGARWKISPRILALAGLLYAIFLANETWIYLPYWRGTEPLTARTLSLTKDNYPAERVMALYCGMIGDHQGEVRHYTAYLRIAPDDYLVWASLARAAQAAGDPVLAEESYKTAIRCFPNYADSWIGYAELLLSIHRTEEARRAIERAGQLAPSDERIPVLEARLEPLSK